LKMKNNFLKAALSVIFLSAAILGAVAFFIYDKKWVGAVFIALGFLHLVVLRFFKVRMRAVWPDVVFGAIDNGILVIGAMIGADFAGILGAIVGGAAANAVTDGFAGVFEGWVAERFKYNKRTALTSAVGKMAGCMFGAGLVFFVAWTLLSLF